VTAAETGSQPQGVTVAVIDGPLAGQTYTVSRGCRQFVAEPDVDLGPLREADAAYRLLLRRQAKSLNGAALEPEIETAGHKVRDLTIAARQRCPAVYTIDRVLMFGRTVYIAHVSQRPDDGLLWDLLASETAKQAAL
jgi:hypothetical protein